MPVKPNFLPKLLPQLSHPSLKITSLNPLHLLKRLASTAQVSVVTGRRSCSQSGLQ